MTETTRPPVSAAINAVSANTDAATRIKACRSVLREALKKIIQIGGGTFVEGIEEIEFGDALDRELAEYLKAKRSRAYGATYVGITGPMDDAIAASAQTVAGAKQQDQGDSQG